MPDFDAIARILGTTPTGSPTPVGGGCIHNSVRWGHYFIKTNSLDQLPNFQAEAIGLQALRSTNTIRVPEVIAHGSHQETAFLVLEHLSLSPSGDDRLLGEQLAELHSHTSTSFGFPSDNFIGATTQPNQPLTSWPQFFRDQRLAHQFRLLTAKGITFPESRALLDRVPELLPDKPPASLLHGDLWSGNKAFLADGTPVIFDPACYYGHASCDLAMTKLFGGFSRRFVDAYRSSSNQDNSSLHDFYNLYHILNHALLFGGSYVDQAHCLIRRFT